MIQNTIIDERFNGPADSGNGGYVAGLMAQPLPGAVRVMLRSAPPLNKPLSLSIASDGVDLLDGETLLANATPVANLRLDVPACPSIEAIKAVAHRYVSADQHILPSCFVCGPLRERGDGLSIFPVALDVADCVASLWKPDPTLLDADGRICSEFMWAALDCPGYFAHQRLDTTMLLGSITAHILHRPFIVAPLDDQDAMISVGWRISAEGRKYRSGTALYDCKGTLCALSEQIWISV